MKMKKKKKKHRRKKEEKRYENNLMSIFEYEFFFSPSDYLSSKRTDSNGRLVKGRGSVVLYRIFCLIDSNVFVNVASKQFLIDSSE